MHAYNFYGNVFAVPPARLAAPVVIASIRDCAPYLTPMQKRVQRYACQFADCVLVNADAVKDWLIGEGYDASKIVVIRNGVDLTRFDGAARPGPASAASSGSRRGTPLVAVVSRLTRLKGLENFLEAAADAEAALSRTRGSSSSARPARCERAVPRRAEGARRPARRRRPRDLHRAAGPTCRRCSSSADVAVMPSLNEALSNVLLESMAAGAPDVATRVGGTPEALVDGETGLLVPPGDRGALAAAVARLLDDRALAARLGQRGARADRDRFSVDRMVQCDRGPLHGAPGAQAAHAAPERPRDARDRARPVAPGPLADRSHDADARGGRSAQCDATVTPSTSSPTTTRSSRSRPSGTTPSSARGVPHPFLRHEWVRTWWDASAPAAGCTSSSSAPTAGSSPSRR